MNSHEIKRDILDRYYTEVYNEFLFNGKGCIRPYQRGIKYFENVLEKFWTTNPPKKALELGGGNGEHLPFVKWSPTEKYVSLDLRTPSNSFHIERANPELISKVEFVQGNAEKIPFADSYFDRILMTCILHHVEDPLAVLLESRRVLSSGGEIGIVMPTDPGITNLILKKLFAYPKIRRISNLDPKLIYALEHKNHARAILSLINHVYRLDRIEQHFLPMRIPSIDLNVCILIHITKL